MSGAALPEGVERVEALSRLQDGDVVWVVTDPSLDPEEQDAVRDVICSSIDQDITVIVTPHGFLEEMHRKPMMELLTLRDLLDEAILHLVNTQAVDEV